jgi:hypothetical protein
MNKFALLLTLLALPIAAFAQDTPSWEAYGSITLAATGVGHALVKPDEGRGNPEGEEIAVKVEPRWNHVGLKRENWRALRDSNSRPSGS